MASKRKVSNPLALAVLAELTVEPLHPYEIGRRLTEHAKDRNFKYTRGSLYMVVSQLERAGFIAEQETLRDTARPERTLYALTQPGRVELSEWLNELVAEPNHEYPLFGVALSLLSIVRPAEAAGLLRTRHAALESELATLNDAVSAAKKAGVSWVFLVDDEYRVVLLQAESEFVLKVIASLEDPSYSAQWDAFFEERS